MTMSIGGLVSGLDTNTLISQLIAAEALPQNRLRAQLGTAQDAAKAYRSVNTMFDGIRAAAEAMLKPQAWTAVKASSTAPSVAVSATPDAAAGSLSFEVKQTAASHVVIGASEYAATTDAAGFTGLEVLDASGAVKGTITVGGTGTLADAAKAINDSSFGLSASVVQISPGKLKLQVTAETSGAAASFDLRNPANATLASPPDDFTTVTQGRNATLKVGDPTTGYEVSSATNSFTGLMTGVTITVSKPETSVTVNIAGDPNAVATSMQALVDAANKALTGIRDRTDPERGESAPLKGDVTLRTLTNQVLNAVSFAVGTSSPARIGLQLEKDGTIRFDQAKFTAELTADPTLAQRIGAGSPAGPGPDGITGNADDLVPGVAQRLLDLAKVASDSTKGTLTLLAKGKDTLADDFSDRIADWDLRLAARREMLTRQFTAMETALGSLRSQSSWLAGQLASLPRSS